MKRRRRRSVRKLNRQRIAGHAKADQKVKGFLNDPRIVFFRLRASNSHRDLNLNLPAQPGGSFASCGRLRSKPMWTLTHPQNRPCGYPVDNERDWRKGTSRTGSLTRNPA
jgi:hypothetical protein